MSRLLLPVLLLISVFVGSSGAYACIQSPCRGYFPDHVAYYPWQGYSYPQQHLSGPMGGFWPRYRSQDYSYPGQRLSGPMGGFWTQPWNPIYPTQPWCCRR